MIIIKKQSFKESRKTASDDPRPAGRRGGGRRIANDKCKSLIPRVAEMSKGNALTGYTIRLH